MMLKEKRALLNAFKELPKMGQTATSGKLRVNHYSLREIFQEQNKIKEAALSQDNHKRSQSFPEVKMDEGFLRERSCDALCHHHSWSNQVCQSIWCWRRPSCPWWMIILAERERGVKAQAAPWGICLAWQWIQRALVWEVTAWMKLKLENIWNCDETALYFQAAPGRTPASPSLMISAGESRKPRGKGYSSSSDLNGWREKEGVERPDCFHQVSLSMPTKVHGWQIRFFSHRPSGLG